MMEEQSLLDIFEKTYKITLNNDQKIRLTNFFKRSGINPENNTIKINSDFKNFLLDITPSTEITITRLTNIILVEEILFMLYPIDTGTEMFINLSIPNKYKYRKGNYNIDNIDTKQNIVIIKSVKFNSTDYEPEFKENYYIYIYNSELEVVSDGIIFI